MTPIRFVHLTDLHISAPGRAGPGPAADAAARLAAVRARIEALDPAPAFVLASGDLTERGDTESFRTLGALLAGFAPPVVWALGNHDTRPGYWQGMAGRTEHLDAPLDHEAVLGGAHVIALDTSRPGRIGGDLDAAQFAFLEAALARHRGVPKLVVMHHAPALDPDPDRAWEALSVAATDRLAAILPGRGVQGVFAGHIHMDRFSLWHGIPVIVGTGLHSAIDPTHPRDAIRVVRGASWSLCTLRASGLTVTCVPLASDRAELRLVATAALCAAEAAAAAAVDGNDGAAGED